MFGITAVVVVALTSVIVITRAVMLSQVTDAANQAVEQEIEEFRHFATDGTDPETAEPFATPARLVEVYLSRQIPDVRESHVGLIGDRLLQMDTTAFSGAHPAPFTSTEPLVHEILDNPAPAGVTVDPERGRAHWGRVSVDFGTDEPAQFAVAYFTDRDRAQVNEQVRTLTALGFGGVVASIIIGWLIAGQIIAPVRRLQEVAGSIGDADLTRRVPVSGNDEIAELATTFNDMLDRLEQAYERQRQFVDDAGHELRTPITVVRGQLELLETTPPEERGRSIALATAELDRMARMVNDLLTLAVADSGEFVVPELIDVAELSIDLEDKARTLSERVSLVEVSEGTVLLDDERITEGVLELVGNALRYSEGPVDLGSTFVDTQAGRSWRIWVRDSGPGVPEHQRTTLFSRFHRGDTAGPRSGGAGLGLAIVHAIGQAHGGRAFVETQVGVGSVFGLEIPAPADKENTQ
ncbi:HAMP domain-containing sensor histidine kinase [Corynebacterium sp.]|uniref:sensor histidine kinase n=1 Tax=Corynebacterium sp. TaxID=1720 RepID=UPI0026DEA8DB|nr:HAMP domain-containing sensor histidine kinase [Corynebacterium sp.]MDO5512535.1 HAMP domain-containing sensor histidine kinase [Corynebacterium sp.]